MRAIGFVSFVAVIGLTSLAFAKGGVSKGVVFRCVDEYDQPIKASVAVGGFFVGKSGEKIQSSLFDGHEDVEVFTEGYHSVSVALTKSKEYKVRLISILVPKDIELKGKRHDSLSATVYYMKNKQALLKSCSAKDCFYIAQLHYFGDRIAQNVDTAKSFYEMGCVKGDYDSCYTLAMVLSKEEQTSAKSRKYVSLYEKGCAANHSLSCNNLAWVYEASPHVKRDYKKAALFYKKGCDLKNAISCSGYGDLLLHGKGMAKNFNESVRFYNKSCLMGGYGCYGLARLFEKLPDVYKSFKQDGKQVLRTKYGLMMEACNAGVSPACVSLRAGKKFIFKDLLGGSADSLLCEVPWVSVGKDLFGCAMVDGPGDFSKIYVRAFISGGNVKGLMGRKMYKDVAKAQSQVNSLVSYFNSTCSLGHSDVGVFIWSCGAYIVTMTFDAKLHAGSVIVELSYDFQFYMSNHSGNVLGTIVNYTDTASLKLKAERAIVVKEDNQGF